MRWAALALAAIALTGCETSAEKSARLERAALANLPPGHGAGTGPLKISRPSAVVKVTSAVLVRDAEGIAAVVTLRNDSAGARQAVPLEINVRDRRGASLYSNTASGLSGSLTTVSYIPAHGTATWVDDQVQLTGTPSAVAAEAGEGKPAGAQAPQIELRRGEVTEEAGGSGVRGTAVNHSRIAQRELVIYAVASKGGRVLAAGRAVLTELAAGASAPFSISLIGPASGGSGLSLSAPATTLR